MTEVYRVQKNRARLFRTWQMEWDGCEFAARSYTEGGAFRRGTRWMRWERSGRPLGLVAIDWHLQRFVWFVYTTWNEARLAPRS